MADDDRNFLSRWSQRKAGARAGVALPPEPLPQPVAEAAVVAVPVAAPVAVEPEPAEAAAPTLAEVEQLTLASDYSRFVAGNVAPQVKNAALKKLFTDPHFNVMDGLDTYIGDYNTPDPLPPGMLRKMVQSQMLGLFDDEDRAAALAAAKAGSVPSTTPLPPPPEEPRCIQAHEDPDLQLQPDPAAGCPGAEPGAGPDAGGQH